jgi:hypothetical protein
MGRSRRSILAIVASSALIAVPDAAAGTPGHWTRVTTASESNINQVSAARTADGTLHVAWTRPTPSNPGGGEDLFQTPITPGGTIGAPVALANNWATLANPAIVAAGGQNLYLFDAATRTTNPTEPISNLALFTSSNGGAGWSLYPADLTKTDAPSDTAAALGLDGTPFIAWGSSSCLCVHRGILQTPNADFQQGLGTYGYEPGIALDQKSHQLIVAWYSNGTAHHGVFTAPVDQLTGARSASPLPMPGTTNLLDGPFSGRTPIVARPGGGVYIAYEGGYPSHTKVLVWRVGARTSTLLARASSDVHGVGIAATPTGRVWVFWSAQSRSGKTLVYAKRSNGSVSAWGRTVAFAPPKRTASVWNLEGDGQTDRLDLLGSFSLGSSGFAATWHTQLLPGLSLSASPMHIPVGGKHARSVTFTVTDAGAPLSGVEVRVGSAHASTGTNGKVTLALGPFKHKRRLRAHATRSGYAPDVITLRAS